MKTLHESGKWRGAGSAGDIGKQHLREAARPAVHQSAYKSAIRKGQNPERKPLTLEERNGYLKNAIDSLAYLESLKKGPHGMLVEGPNEPEHTNLSASGALLYSMMSDHYGRAGNISREEELFRKSLELFEAIKKHVPVDSDGQFTRGPGECDKSTISSLPVSILAMRLGDAETAAGQAFKEDTHKRWSTKDGRTGSLYLSDTDVKQENPRTFVNALKGIQDFMNGERELAAVQYALIDAFVPKKYGVHTVYAEMAGENYGRRDIEDLIVTPEVTYAVAILGICVRGAEYAEDYCKKAMELGNENAHARILSGIMTAMLSGIRLRRFRQART